MRLRRVRDASLAVLLGFGLGSAVIAANDLRLRRSGEELGAVDFFKYCGEVQGETATATLFTNDAYGWRCVILSPVVRFTEIDWNDACTRYWDVAAVARTDDPTNPYSWRCYRR